MKINQFCVGRTSKGTYVFDLEKLVEACNYRNTSGLEFEEENGSVHDSLAIWKTDDDSWGIRCWSGNIRVCAKAEFIHKSNDIVSNVTYDDLDNTLQPFYSQDEEDDILGYRQWRHWRDRFVFDHGCHWIYGLDQYRPMWALYEGALIVSGTDFDGKVNWLQVMADETRRQDRPKYLNMIKGGRKPLVFDGKYRHQRKGLPLLLVEGMIDMYQANEVFTEQEVNVACLNGKRIQGSMADDLHDFIITWKPSRIHVYLENDVEDAKRGIYRDLQTLLDKIFDETGTAPGVTFRRWETDEAMFTPKGMLYKIDFDAYKQLVDSMERGKEDFKFVETGSTYTTEDGVIRVCKHVPPIPERIDNPNAIHISGTTGDGKTQTAKSIMMKADGKCRILFCCHNVDEVRNFYETTGRKFLAVSGDFPYGLATKADAYYQEFLPKCQGKTEEIEKLDEYCKELFYQDLMSANESARCIVTTHWYMHKLFTYWTKYYQPELVIIDESFELYNKWYTSEKYKFADKWGCKTSIFEEMPHDQHVVYLDGTGEYMLPIYHGYFGHPARTYRCGILQGMSQANCMIPSLEELLSDPECQLSPKPHDHFHINLNVIEDASMIRRATTYSNKSKAGDFIVNMILRSVNVDLHTNKLLLVTWKECVYAIKHALDKYQTEHQCVLNFDHEVGIGGYYVVDEMLHDNRSLRAKFDDYSQKDQDNLQLTARDEWIQASEAYREAQAEMARRNDMESQFAVMDAFKKRKEAENKYFDRVTEDNYELKMASRQSAYEISAEAGEKLGEFMSKFDSIVIASHAHGRGTNKFREADNIIYLGGFYRPGSSQMDALAEMWQNIMRGQARMGKYCLVNCWLTQGMLPELEKGFNQWDNQDYDAQEDLRLHPNKMFVKIREEEAKRAKSKVYFNLYTYDASQPGNLMWYDNIVGWNEWHKFVSTIREEVRTKLKFGCGQRTVRENIMYQHGMLGDVQELETKHRSEMGNAKGGKIGGKRSPLEQLTIEELVERVKSGSDKQKEAARRQLRDRLNCRDWAECRITLEGMGYELPSRNGK